MQRVVGGDTGLFELLIRGHDQRVYRTARAIVRNETDAEDVVQETYLRAVQHLRQFEGRARFSTWLLKHRLLTSLAGLKISPGIVRDVQSNAIKLAGLESPANLDARIAALIRARVAQSFVFGFKIVMLICSGLAMASIVVVMVMIPPAKGERTDRALAIYQE